MLGPIQQIRPDFDHHLKGRFFWFADRLGFSWPQMHLMLKAMSIDTFLLDREKDLLTLSDDSFNFLFLLEDICAKGFIYCSISVWHINSPGRARLEKEIELPVFSRAAK